MHVRLLYSVGMDTSDTKEIQTILDFWFKEVTPKQKFTKDAEFDALVREKFEATYWNIMKRGTSSWRETPEGRLAEIIVLDQFARNMFRDQAQSFAEDELALSLARDARVAGADKEVPLEWRTFFYMPYMHSESKEVHEEALRIFTEHGVKENLEYEIKHKAIIDRFGRYPHRNAILGRESTPEELVFLETEGGF